MAIATNTLMEEGKCYACTGELSAPQILELTLLRRQALVVNATADVTVNGLLAIAKCYACMGASMFELLKLGLLNIIAGSPGVAVSGFDASE